MSPIDAAGEARSYVKRRPVLFAAGIFVPWALVVRPDLPVLIAGLAVAVLVLGWRAVS